MDLHWLASFFQWKSIIISNVQISHLFEAIRFFSFFSSRFLKWPRHLLICLSRLGNFAINVGRCQNTAFYSNNLNVLHAKDSSFLNILTVYQFCSVKVCRSYKFSKIPPTKLRNVQSVTCLKLKAIFSNVGPDLETNQW